MGLSLPDRSSGVAHVHPTQDDDLVAALSDVVGGPVGEHAGRHRWLTPIAALLVITAITFALGLTSKTACAAHDFDGSRAGAARLCESDIAVAYLGEGFVERVWPWSEDQQTRSRHEVPHESAVVGMWAYASARVTHLLAGSPDLGERYRVPVSTLGARGDDEHEALDEQIDHERLLFTAVNAVGLAGLALLATLALAAVRRRRPWDAAGFAAAPVLLLTGAVSWDLLAVAAVAGALWAWSRGRPAVAGALVGLGVAAGVWPVLLLPAAALVLARRGRALELLSTVVTGLATWGLLNAPAFLSGRSAWEAYWSTAVHRGPDRGSLWLILDQTAGISQAAALAGASVLIALWMAGVGYVCATASRVPRLSQVAFLLVAGVLLLGVSYAPVQALWLLPLAALARPRWRDLAIWQSGAVLFFALDSWWSGGFLEPGGGGQAGFYWVGIGVRMLCLLWLVGVVVRDVLAPEHDPVGPEGQDTMTRSNVVAV